MTRYRKDSKPPARRHTTREEWAAETADMPSDMLDAMRVVWTVLGPVDLIPNPPTPLCKICGSHNWTRYGEGGSNICTPCRETFT